MYNAGVLVASDSAGIVDVDIDFSSKTVTSNVYIESIKPLLVNWANDEKQKENSYIGKAIFGVEDYFKNA